MRPFYRKRNYYRNYWNSTYKRRQFRRRRPTTTFRGRKRRRKTVRRKRFFKKYFKKLKTIKIRQWQPATIKKCKITGYLVMFQAGKGRFSYNYAQYKESFVPPHTPGGGGWSIQQLSLNDLYVENTNLFNYWTKSNHRLPLVRYMGVKVTLFRQQFTDWIFTYFADMPKTVTKYFYASHHPLNLLTHNRKVVIPSFNTQPHKRKPYKKIFIKPPKQFKNQWYFTQNFCQIPLITFAAAACSLGTMFGSNTSQNNNCTIYILDDRQIKYPCFQYKTQTHPQYGYRPNEKYWYGSPHPPLTQKLTYGDLAYLGNTNVNDTGITINEGKYTTQQLYTYKDWGNIFYWGYLTGNMELIQSDKNPQQAVTCKTEEIQTSQLKQLPIISSVRYNPFKDKGKGNEVYFIPNYDASKTDWEPTGDPDIHFEGFPLWIILWGIEGIIKKMGKCPHMDDDWICVIKSSYFNTPETHYIPLSYNFIHGLAPYSAEREDITTADNRTWYPKWKFQKEAIENIINTGFAVCRADNIKNIQAYIKYDFLFKWGGSPAPMENVYDPTTFPITPIPSDLNLQNEITDPNTPLQSFLYQWDQRRDLITEKAIERIKQSTTNEVPVFTDGRQSSTDVQLFKEKPPPQTTPEKEEETLLLLQLQQLQQYNQLLQQRFLRLKQSLMDL
nr:MAG: ORF1 [TTV-like mini virus]